MQLVYKTNLANKLYAQSFVEIRQSGIQAREGQYVNIILDGKPFNTGSIRALHTKVARELTESECYLAFGISKDEAIKLVRRIYNNQFAEMMNVDVMVVVQDLDNLQRKFQTTQSELFL
jgi:hypothetical protein